MQKKTMRYWICQLLGWGGWTSLNLFFVYLFANDYYLKSEERKYIFFGSLIIQFLWYIIATHGLRFVLKKIGWINFSIDKVIGLFVVSVLITGLFIHYGAKITARSTNYSMVQYEKNENKKAAISREETRNVKGTTYYLAQEDNPKDSANFNIKQRIKRNTGWYRDAQGQWQYEEQRKGRFWWDLIFNFILIALWLLIYMVWHYLLRNQKDEVDKLSLEKTVKELELQTIKSHINPHFIFNSLNSIRALVEENPSRARKAITELSNILRSSLQVEKMETVTLKKELSIVKDYLALEQMRFEERLRIELDIDEATLDQPVPPMMLQTLVENSIKHGISKQINGGIVRVVSRFNNDQFELIVQNTGNLEEDAVDGFGFKSTHERLKILYGKSAVFAISEIKENMVEAKIQMPKNS
ncbi:MAG: histidine kinase [Ginsengibacter sp.]|jgi:two-component sensor histidine kinase